LLGVAVARPLFPPLQFTFTNAPAEAVKLQEGGSTSLKISPSFAVPPSNVIPNNLFSKRVNEPKGISPFVPLKLSISLNPLPLVSIENITPSAFAPPAVVIPANIPDGETINEPKGCEPSVLEPLKLCKSLYDELPTLGFIENTTP